MKTLKNLQSPVLNLDKQPLTEQDGKPISVGSLLANALARGADKEPIRAMDLALKIYNAKGELEIEDPDFTMLKEAVEKDQLMNNLAKASALKSLE